jgi:diguanylate cyclase (GGDEF)-like protein/PAS domain S-box-containing protein
MVLQGNWDFARVLSLALGPTLLKSAVISAAVISVLGAAAGLLWSRRKIQRPGVPADELSFRAAAHAAPTILWTARPDGTVDFISRQLFRYTGLTEEESMNWGWAQTLHPEDLEPCKERWERSLREGSPYEIEYRVRRSDGVYRWFLVKGNPLRDERGTIVKWIGACLDVEEQKHHQQILEQEIKERTEELASANTRLQEEMLERDYARRQLDERNEEMMRDLTQRTQRATLLAKMGEVMQSCISKEEVFAAALGFAPRIFPNSRGAVALLNSRRDLAEIAGSWHDCQLSEAVFEPHRCWALRTGHPHLVPAGDSTAPCAHAVGVNNTYLCIPILAQGEALGILHFQATDETPTMADSELSFKTTFAGQVGLSVANIRLREALRAQSIKDPLTGLYNRRYLEEMLEREIRRAVRAEQPLGLLMLDLDHFKKFNDTYGHDAGDMVLRESGNFLVKSVRAEDTVCRFGGEEFVIILPTANLGAACARADRIRSKLREMTLLHQGQSLGMVTVSVGVAALPEQGSSPKELLEAADAALYRAKNEGRDRVVAAEIRSKPEVELPSPQANAH